MREEKEPARSTHATADEPDEGRRRLLTTGVGLASALLLAPVRGAAQMGGNLPAAGEQRGAAARGGPSTRQRALRPGMPGREYQPTIVPNGTKAPWRIVDGVKVFHLVAEEVEHEFASGLSARCWGYNGSVHGPTIEAVEGDRVRIYVSNRLPASTSVHWHGILLPSGMDGVAGLSQAAIKPGETFKYEFTLRQHGTNMYHSHHDEMTQIGMGLTGMFVIHPRRPTGPRVDRDFVILLHEWRIDVGTSRPNPNEMTDFNLLTMNGKVFPATDPLVVRTGERVRIRLGNLGPQNHHPIHLHGFHFWVTHTDGGDVPSSAQRPEATVLVSVGTTRAIEFIADEPGDWALHCHMTHHTMNQMGHDFPNMIGVRPEGLEQLVRPLLPGYMTMGQDGMDGMEKHLAHMPIPPNSIPMLGEEGPHDYILMGGMFTIVKVRSELQGYEDPGWYRSPPNTIAMPADPAELQRDGVDPAGVRDREGAPGAAARGSDSGSKGL